MKSSSGADVVSEGRQHPPRPLYHFAYSPPVREDRPVFLHDQRDGEAFSYRQQALNDKGYKLVDTVLNCPPVPYGLPVGGPADELSSTFRAPNALVATTTRTPVDDEVDAVWGRVDRSGTTAEDRAVALHSRRRILCQRKPQRRRHP